MIYGEKIHHEQKRELICSKGIWLYGEYFSLQDNAFEELMCFQRALRELISATDAIYAKQFEEFFVGLEGRFV
jgi:hypothetical protein